MLVLATGLFPSAPVGSHTVDTFGKPETKPQVPELIKSSYVQHPSIPGLSPSVGLPLPTLDKLLDPYHLWPSPHGPDITRTLLKPMFTASLMTGKE